MTIFNDILRWVDEGESETLELKATTSTLPSATKTLSAMLNGQGGRVLFGVQPTSKVPGQQIGAETLKRVTQASRDIRPWYTPSITRVPLPDDSGYEVIVVTVPSGNNKPYTYKGIYYMRSGSSTVKMPHEIQISLFLEQAHGWDRWETQDSRRDLTAIDESEVNAFRDEAVKAGRASFEPNASVTEVLTAMNLLDSEGRPNRGAVALFGRREAFSGQYPTLGCRLVAVSGTDIEEEFKDDALVEGNMFMSMRRAEAFCQEHLHRPARITGYYNTSRSEVPSEAVREALVNAFGHRDYTVSGLVQVQVFRDRLEVWSPGRLHFGLKPADLYELHSSNPWNPNMFSCMYRRGLVEQLGSGTLRMARLCKQAGLGRPVFTVRGASVTCSIPRKGFWLAPDGSSMAIDATDAAVLSLLSDGPAARGQITANIGTTTVHAREVLVRLHNQGLVRVEGHGRGSRWLLNNG